MENFVTQELHYTTGAPVQYRFHDTLKAAVEFAESYLYHYRILTKEGRQVPSAEVKEMIKLVRAVIGARSCL